jgi:hypothetical protein
LFVKFNNPIFRFKRPKQRKLREMTDVHFKEFCFVVDKCPWHWAGFGSIIPTKRTNDTLSGGTMACSGLNIGPFTPAIFAANLSAIFSF